MRDVGHLFRVVQGFQSLEGVWAVLAAKCVLGGVLGGSWVGLGRVLGPSWGHLGAQDGPSNLQDLPQTESNGRPRES